MSSNQPHVIILGGPNGAGKSTSAQHLLQGALAVTEFVNADTVAQGLSAFAPDRTAMYAGRIMLARLRELAAERVDFAFETTMSSRSFAPWITGLIQIGYTFHSIYLWLPRPELAIARVKERVRAGGHNVPEDIVRRRYHGGLMNFFNLYQPLSTTWRFYDNSNSPEPKLLAAGKGTTIDHIASLDTWNQVTKGLKRG